MCFVAKTEMRVTILMSVLTLNTYRNTKMTFCGFKGSYMLEPFLGKQPPGALTVRNFPELDTA